MNDMSRRLVILFGPPAVGKMAVGKEMARLTGMRLFHNHMALEPVLQLFPYGSPPFERVVRQFRNAVFEEAARADGPGLIYTCMWDLDDDEMNRYIDWVVSLFERQGATAGFVELSASLEVRLQRNRTELRLAEKPSKRDLDASEARLLANESRRLNSTGDFPYPDRHLLLVTDTMTAEQAAATIVQRLHHDEVAQGSRN
jgi:hypothetical protein